MDYLIIEYNFNGVRRSAYADQFDTFGEIWSRLDMPDEDTLPIGTKERLENIWRRDCKDISELPCLWAVHIGYWDVCKICGHIDTMED